MIVLSRVPPSRWRLVAALSLTAILAACGGNGKPKLPVAGERDADKFLYDRGTEALRKKHWIEAREYFRRLVDTYPNSQYRQDAKLGIGDAFIGEGRIDTYILAVNEFREFLNYFPTAQRADYAQYRLATASMKQMLAPERDQTATRDALREFDTFVRAYPGSKLLPDALKLQRQVRDRLSRSEYLVGVHYFRTRWYPGALSRLQGLLTADPQFTGRDGVYFYLGETLMKMNKPADAASYYEKLVGEFAVSDYLKDAKKRLAEIKPATP